MITVSFLLGLVWRIILSLVCLGSAILGAVFTYKAVMLGSWSGAQLAFLLLALASVCWMRSTMFEWSDEECSTEGFTSAAGIAGFACITAYAWFGYDVKLFWVGAGLFLIGIFID